MPSGKSSLVAYMQSSNTTSKQPQSATSPLSISISSSRHNNQQDILAKATEAIFTTSPNSPPTMLYSSGAPIPPVVTLAALNESESLSVGYVIGLDGIDSNREIDETKAI